VRKERKMRGFTLVELLIVLLILGILIGLAIPRYLSALDTAKKNTFCSNVRNVLSAVETWRMTTGTTAYPDSNTLNTKIIQTATYFSQPPINPYQDNATLLSANSASTATQPDGYFYYNKGQVITWPDCGLNAPAPTTP